MPSKRQRLDKKWDARVDREDLRSWKRDKGWHNLIIYQIWHTNKYGWPFHPRLHDWFVRGDEHTERLCADKKRHDEQIRSMNERTQKEA